MPVTPARLCRLLRTKRKKNTTTTAVVSGIPFESEATVTPSSRKSCARPTFRQEVEKLLARYLLSKPEAQLEKLSRQILAWATSRDKPGAALFAALRDGYLDGAVTEVCDGGPAVPNDGGWAEKNRRHKEAWSMEMANRPEADLANPNYREDLRQLRDLGVGSTRFIRECFVLDAKYKDFPDGALAIRQLEQLMSTTPTDPLDCPLASGPSQADHVDLRNAENQIDPGRV